MPTPEMDDMTSVYPLFFYHNCIIGHILSDHTIYWNGYKTSVSDIKDFRLMASINKTLNSLLQNLPPEE